MAHGTGSTLILRPKGGTALTFNLSAALASVTTYTCIVDVGRLDFNEEARWQWVYDQSQRGGRVSGSTAQLIPVTFPVIIKATSSDYRKQAYRALQTALLNRRGGTLQYKPEGAAVGTRDTYYHYIASRPPRLVDEPGNRWDADADSDGFYTLQVEVELVTQPLATSDPDNPVTVASLGATIDNWVDTSPSQTNRITVLSTDLDGSMPALVRMLITPASGQRLGRVVVFRRSDGDGTLANLKTLYEAEDATTIPPTSAWSEVADANRGDGAYMRCLPNDDANGVAHGLRFTLTNPGDAKGRFAVFGIGYDDAPEAGVWTHQAKLRSGNISQTGNADYYAASTQNWQAVFVGEFELPLADLSDLTAGYDEGPYLEWYSTRASGSSEFRLDAVMLVWVSDSLGPDGDGTALDVICDVENYGEIFGGIETPDKLLIENLLGLAGIVTGRAYIVASDNDLERVLRTAPRGDFIELEPGHNHLLVFAQERFNNVIFGDDFEDYRARHWLPVAQMEDDEGWGYNTTNASKETSVYVEGDLARKITFDSTEQFYDQRWMGGAALDLSDDDRFNDDDYVVIAMWVDDHIVDINLEMRDVGDSFHYEWASLSAGWNYLYIKRSDLLETGSPSWDHITALMFVGTLSGWYGSDEYLIADAWRIEKADPDDADVPNATGDVWDFQPNAGVWTITADVSESSLIVELSAVAEKWNYGKSTTANTTTAALACLDVEDGVEKVALLARTVPDDVRFRARVCAKRDAGTVGLLWRAGADCLTTAGAEDTYAVTLNVGGDTLNVLEYTNGTPASLYSTAYALEVDRWYTLGIQAKGDAHRIYAALSSTLEYDDSAVFGEDYLKTALTDASYASGQIGVVSQSTLGRFDNVVLESIEDKVMPADQITVSGQAVFRTIAPFD